MKNIRESSHGHFQRKDNLIVYSKKRKILSSLAILLDLVILLHVHFLRAIKENCTLGIVFALVSTLIIRTMVNFLFWQFSAIRTLPVEKVKRPCRFSRCKWYWGFFILVFMIICLILTLIFNDRSLRDHKLLKRPLLAFQVSLHS